QQEHHRERGEEHRQRLGDEGDDGAQGRAQGRAADGDRGGRFSVWRLGGGDAGLWRERFRGGGSRSGSVNGRVRGSVSGRIGGRVSGRIGGRVGGDRRFLRRGCGSGRLGSGGGLRR